MPIVQDSSAPLIAITGATGNQGGSVLSHLAKSSKSYRVRAITRDATKPSATALKEQGAEVVSADLDNKSEAEKAFEGAEIVFAVTNFWAHMSKDKELEQGKILADAAKKNGVKLFIWSGLHDVNKVTGGKLTHVDHFDGKADIRKYAEDIGLKVLNVEAACYLQNFEGFLKPQKTGEDEYTYFLPVKGTTPVHFIDINYDYGNFVVSALDLPESSRPSDVYTVSELVDLDTVVAEIARNTGKKVKYQGLTGEQFNGALKQAGLPESLIHELSEMWQFFDSHGYYGGDKATELKLQHPQRTAKEFFALDSTKKALEAVF